MSYDRDPIALENCTIWMNFFLPRSRGLCSALSSIHAPGFRKNSIKYSIYLISTVSVMKYITIFNLQPVILFNILVKIKKGDTLRFFIFKVAGLHRIFFYAKHNT